MGAERVLATAVKRVAVFPAVGATLLVLIGRSGLVDKKVGGEKNVPDPLFCPGNLRRAPWDSRLPFVQKEILFRERFCSERDFASYMISYQRHLEPEMEGEERKQSSKTLGRS